MAFSLTLFSGYLSGILLSDCFYRAVNYISIQIRTPLLEQVYPSIRRVSERSFNLQLLVKPYMRISRIRLSSGISHNRRQNSLTDNPTGFDYQHLFYHSSRSDARWRFRLLFSAAYLSGILLSDWCYHAVSLYSIQIRTPSLGQVFPST